jgi:porphyrinogen peroxidase
MVSQNVTAPLTRAATFLIVSASSRSAITTIRATKSRIGDITNDLSIRFPDGRLSCTVGIGSSIWSRLTSLTRPKELHPFREVRGAKHTAVSTPGDILFHIKADRQGLCFELENN